MKHEYKDIPVTNNEFIKPKPKFKTKQCKIITYNKHSHVAVIDFDGTIIQTTILDMKSKDGMCTVRYSGSLQNGLRIETETE